MKPGNAVTELKPGDFVRADGRPELRGTITEVVDEYKNDLGGQTQVVMVAWFGYGSLELDHDLILDEPSEEPS